jgi:hypothetical protein
MLARGKGHVGQQQACRFGSLSSPSVPSDFNHFVAHILVSSFLLLSDIDFASDSA